MMYYCLASSSTIDQPKCIIKSYNRTYFTILLLNSEEKDQPSSMYNYFSDTKKFGHAAKKFGHTTKKFGHETKKLGHVKTLKFGLSSDTSLGAPIMT